MRCSLLITAALLASCSSAPIDNRPPYQQFLCRDDGDPAVRRPLYRARVPASWQRIDTASDVSIADSRLPIAEFVIDGAITVVIHTFPYDDAEQRIPPQAQVFRWKQQLTDLDPTTITTQPYGHGGYAGIAFAATGTLDGTPNTTVLGWAQQLSLDHFRHLDDRHHRADYTIKVVGPADAVATHRTALEAFARSFELIDEVPSRR